MSKTKHPRPSRYGLSQTQWERIEDLLPGKAGDPGRTAVDNRSFVNGVLWVLRSGARWSDLPTRYGAYKSVHKRFTRWAAKGIWELVFQSLIEDRNNEYLMIDSSIVRAHAQAATGKGGQRNPALGRSRGGLSTKTHMAVDGQGRPVRFILTGGQRNDITQAPALLAGFKPKYVLADKGYDSRQLVALIQSLGAQPVIPPRSCQQPRAYDKARYRLRNRIERCFARLKQFRRIATRFDRKPSRFLAFLYLASIPLWMG
ncbi:IS5 family transposase [Allofranklinella schreckenbergeri]|uniref:IS5 family transposase n=1 Tax=Allofranklinella schreckenbergeri TaxID=1076744 RepID=A0A3M6QSS6_9BURK|nr:IS5 family transposase [Allofranklinella schreckenbergeri]